MSNKENLWRLQDEEGQPAAKKPMPKWDAIFKMKMPDGEYKDIAKLQSLSYARELQPVYEMGSAMPAHHVTMPTSISGTLSFSNTVVDATASLARENSRRLDERIREEIVHMTEGNIFAGAPTMRHETIEQTIPAIFDVIMAEMDRYRSRYYDLPRFISLNKEAYRSFWLQTRRRMPADVNDGDFMGMIVMCNPLQELPVMILGSGIQEGIEGRLYNE